MPYQYKREPLSDDEVNRLTNTCESFEEKFAIETLLDTGLRVSEFANLKKDNIQWQERRLIIYGKGGPYGKKTKRRMAGLPTPAFGFLIYDGLVKSKFSPPPAGGD